MCLVAWTWLWPSLGSLQMKLLSLLWKLRVRLTTPMLVGMLPVLSYPWSLLRVE